MREYKRKLPEEDYSGVEIALNKKNYYKEIAQMRSDLEKSCAEVSELAAKLPKPKKPKHEVDGTINHWLFTPEIRQNE